MKLHSLYPKSGPLTVDCSIFYIEGTYIGVIHDSTSPFRPTRVNHDSIRCLRPAKVNYYSTGCLRRVSTGHVSIRTLWQHIVSGHSVFGSRMGFTPCSPPGERGPGEYICQATYTKFDITGGLIALQRLSPRSLYSLNLALIMGQGNKIFAREFWEAYVALFAETHTYRKREGREAGGRKRQRKWKIVRRDIFVIRKTVALCVSLLLCDCFISLHFRMCVSCCPNIDSRSINRRETSCRGIGVYSRWD